MKKIHFIAFGALAPVDNGYKSTATQLVRALSKLADVTLFRLPKLGDEPLVALDDFDGCCADLRVPVVRVALQRRQLLHRFLGAPIGTALRAHFGAKTDWIEALQNARLGKNEARILCFGMGWDPFAAVALSHFRRAYFFPADSITIFERNRSATNWRRSIKRRLATAVAACVERRVARGGIERVLFVSARDAACVARLVHNRRRVAVVPIGVDPEEFAEPASLSGPPRLIFSGVMDYLPNQDAVRFLITEIFPRVQTRDVGLIIVGKGAATLKPLARERVEFRDWVPSLPQALREGSVFVCPLRMGAGAKNKVVQAMAAGLPVVGTRSSFSGFSGRPPGVFVEDDPWAFARAIDDLLLDENLRRSASRAARAFALKNCTWAAAAARLLDVIKSPEKMSLHAD